MLSSCAAAAKLRAAPLNASHSVVMESAVLLYATTLTLLT